MIEIDGKMGYGQVLRTAIALSAITLEPVKIYNIRVRRPKPGLMQQHLTGVLEAAKLCHAKLKGAKKGSTTIEFYPQRLDVPSKIFIDIKTAGSITLLLQTLLPIIITSKKKVELTIIGGTNVRGSPTVEYYQKVFLYYLKLLGVDAGMQIERYGFYPKGGGKVKVGVNPSELKPIKLIERGKLQEVNAWSVASKSLQKARVAERQLNGLKEVVNVNNSSFAYVDAYSTGSSLFCEAVYENCKLGEDGLGVKGKPAESIGRGVGLGLKESMESGACLDKYMADQLLPYLALAPGTSKVSIEKQTEHFVTNLKVCERMLDVKFKIEKNVVTVTSSI